MTDPTDLAAFRVFRTLSPQRVLSGEGALAKLAGTLERMGLSRLLIATSNSIANATPLLRDARAQMGSRVVAEFAACRQHSPEADIVAVQDLIRSHRADAVLSIGGSSVFDTVKIAIGREAVRVDSTPISHIAVPTTLSAGEFTPGAGYVDAESGLKKIVMDIRLTPTVVVLDPAATIYTPEVLWLSTGIKAFDHAVEAVWSQRPHPYVDALALEAVRLLLIHLPRSRSGDLGSRGACQLAAWMSIAGVGASGMRLSHFLGHQIGAAMDLPHGITSCILLPTVMRYLRDRTLDAQLRIAAAMGVSATGKSPTDIADEAAAMLERFIVDLGLPASIAAAGGREEQLGEVARNSMIAAHDLGLVGDLPNGEASVMEILNRAMH